MISGSLGKDGWIKWNYYRTHEDPWPEVDFDVSLEPKHKSRIVDFKTAGMNVAKDIGESYDNIYLALSGGIDSEFAAQCFLKAGVPFTPIIANMKGSNEIDSWFAYRWCRINNIDPLIVDVSVEELKETLISNSKKTFCRMKFGPGLFTLLEKKVKNLNGTLVTGAGDIEYFPDDAFFIRKKQTPYPPKDSHLIDNDNNILVNGWLIYENSITMSMFLKDAPWNFYTWTPEIVLSLIANYDKTADWQENKIALTGCMPRPKLQSISGSWTNQDNDLSQLNILRSSIGTAENIFLGETTSLIKLLS